MNVVGDGEPSLWRAPEILVLPQQLDAVLGLLLALGWCGEVCSGRAVKVARLCDSAVCLAMVIAKTQVPPFCILSLPCFLSHLLDSLWRLSGFKECNPPLNSFFPCILQGVLDDICSISLQHRSLLLSLVLLNLLSSFWCSNAQISHMYLCAKLGICFDCSCSMCCNFKERD